MSDRSAGPVGSLASGIGAPGSGTTGRMLEFAKSRNSMNVDETSTAYHAGQTFGRIVSTGVSLYQMASGLGFILGGLAAGPAIVATGAELGAGLGAISGGGVASLETGSVGAVAGALAGVGVVVLIEGVGAVLIVDGAMVLANNWNNPVQYARGSGSGSGEWRPLGEKDLPDSYKAPRGGARRVKVQYGPYTDRVGYLDKYGDIWVACKPGECHGGLHWDVQINGGKGGHYNVFIDP